MNKTAYANVSTNERVLRYILGFGLIASVLGFHSPPHWMTLAATYPVFTAIMAWDPLYYLYDQLKVRFPATLPRHKKKKFKRPAPAGSPA